MEVRWAVLKNPAVPEDVWRKALLEGKPEAWSNPMAPIYLLVWSPQPGDWRTLNDATYWTAIRLWRNPARCSPDGKVLLNVQLINWWACTEYTRRMMDILSVWASAKGNGSDEHREVVRLLILCVRTVPNLPAEDRQALNLLEAWCNGRENNINEVKALASSNFVKYTAQFATNFSRWYDVDNLIAELTEYLATKTEEEEFEEAVAEHDRLLADLIRREMPLPPQFE